MSEASSLMKAHPHGAAESRCIPYTEHARGKNECQSFEAYKAAKLNAEELSGLIFHFVGVGLATAEFWVQLWEGLTWEIYAIDPRFWDCMKRLGKVYGERYERCRAKGERMERCQGDSEFPVILIAQASGLLGLSEPSWRMRSWSNLYSEPPSVLGKGWRERLAKDLHTKQKPAKKVVRFEGS